MILPSQVEMYDDTLLLSHETIHVIQSDQVYWLLAADVDDWLGHRLLPDTWADHLTLGVHIAIKGIADQLLSYEERPWETEAYRLVHP